MSNPDLQGSKIFVQSSLQGVRSYETLQRLKALFNYQWFIKNLVNELYKLTEIQLVYY